ncbi:MAG: tryptophanase [Candidatus Dadabacteria bacterium]|nr:MAG: tryptophanase [Candidatus Dadabacteria bacterium]
MPDVVFEPFKIKSVEPINFSTVEERKAWLKEAGYNMFGLPAERVMIDLLTDSGTSAMSHNQWAALISGDESYAGSKDFYALERVAREIFQKDIVIPVHQGRAGEHLVFSTLLKKGDIVPSNSHFDTTGANIEDCGAEALNLPTKEGLDPFLVHPFKGNMDTEALKRLLKEKREHVPFVMLTITNNTGGGQPVSYRNISEVRKICDSYSLPLFIDGCRFAENAYFIKLRENGFNNLSAKVIAQKTLSLADLVIFSAKKDAFANIGGLVCLNDPELAERLKNRLVVTEGFATYGGLAGRDLAAIAQGLLEITDEHYLKYRLRTIEWMVERLAAEDIPVLRPAGGHALYIDADSFFPNIPPENFPGIALVNELYIRGGIRAVELGNVAFGKRDKDGKHIFPRLDLVRLAMPRRVYTEAHAAYVVEHIKALYRERDKVSGWVFDKEAPVLRHFRSTFKPA